MSNFENVLAQLEKHLGGQTLATLRDEAAKEMNGVCWKSVRTDKGPRWFLLFCFTDGYERRKLDHLAPKAGIDFGDWRSVSLTEAVARAILQREFIYAFDLKSPDRSRAIVLIAADPDSVTTLQEAFNLPP